MRYSVFVKPNSKKGPLVEKNPEHPTELTVFLREKPIDGEANTALIKLLSEYFSIRKTAISIISGVNSRHKLVEVDF